MSDEAEKLLGPDGLGDDVLAGALNKIPGVSAKYVQEEDHWSPGVNSDLVPGAMGVEVSWNEER